MRNRVLLFSFALITVLVPPVTTAFGSDMFSGTWRMNLAKSYSPGASSTPKVCPTQEIAAVHKGLTVVTDSVSATGQATHTEFTVKFDGKDYAENATVNGKPTSNPDSETVSAQKIDDYTVVFTLKLDGRVIGTRKEVVSSDGKTRTVTQTNTDSRGQTDIYTMVFEKQ
jgi:hypothetical protein